MRERLSGIPEKSYVSLRRKKDWVLEIKRNLTQHC